MEFNCPCTISVALTIHKTWFEFLFVAQFLFMFHIPESFYWKEYGADDNFECVPNPDIWPLSWLTQFSLLGGELWLAVLSMDIHVALTNPFTSYAANANKFKMWVYGLAITTATVLVCYDPIQYGLSNEPLIWIQVRDETFNLAKILCFFVFMFVIYTYSAFICVWARNQIYKGLEETLIARRYSVRKQTICKF